MGIYTYPKFAYAGPADLQAGAPQRRPLVIVGAGPVGLAAAIDARLKGIPVLVFDEDDTVSIGSRAVCYAKRALEVLDRLGVGDPIVRQGRELERGPHLLPRERGLPASTWCPTPATSAPA